MKNIFYQNQFEYKHFRHKYWESKKNCPNCNHVWSEGIHHGMRLKKVDFIWINREQKSFEWFLQMLSQLEMEQAEFGEKETKPNFLDIHLYITTLSETKDLKAVTLKLALDLMHQKVEQLTKVLVCMNY